MHEVSLMEQVIELACTTATRENAQEIRSMRLKIGVHSGVVREALLFAFDVVKEGTMAARAKLSIDCVPVSCWCTVCNQSFFPQEWAYFCPTCQQWSSQVLTGKEMQLVSVEVC